MNDTIKSNKKRWFFKISESNQHDSVQIFGCKSKHSSVNLIFPVRQKETLQHAIHRYITLNKQSNIWSQFFGDYLSKIKIEHTPTSYLFNKQITDENVDEKILLIGNKANDHTNESKRIAFFERKFRSLGSKTFLLPVNADIGLSEVEKIDFRNKICKKFGTTIFMGGDDISPSIYFEQNTSCQNTFENRDLWESSFINPILKSENTIIVGICRGAQLISAHLGYNLIQDITYKKLINSNHTQSTKHIIHQINESTFLNTKNKKPLAVNSYHHQSIKYISGGPIKITHVSDDGIGEVFEIKGKKSILVQFHPEMNYELHSSQLFFSELNKRQKKTRPFGRV